MKMLKCSTKKFELEEKLS